MEDQPPVPMILNLEFVHFWLAAALPFPPRASTRTHHRAEVCNYYFADFYHSVETNWFYLQNLESFVFSLTESSFTDIYCQTFREIDHGQARAWICLHRALPGSKARYIWPKKTDKALCWQQVLYRELYSGKVNYMYKPIKPFFAIETQD